MVHISPTLCFSIAAVAWANHHESLSLSPAEHSVVRYTNESLIVQCRSPDPKVVLHWKSPKGEIIREHKGRIHIEQTSAGKDRMGLGDTEGLGWYELDKTERNTAGEWIVGAGGQGSGVE